MLVMLSLSAKRKDGRCYRSDARYIFVGIEKISDSRAKAR
jgi:hypothetical protein